MRTGFLAFGLWAIFLYHFCLLCLVLVFGVWCLSFLEYFVHLFLVFSLLIPFLLLHFGSDPFVSSLLGSHWAGMRDFDSYALVARNTCLFTVTDLHVLNCWVPLGAFATHDTNVMLYVGAFC